MAILLLGSVMLISCGSRFSKVCEAKEGVNRAAQYVENEDFHPVVLLSSSGELHKWSGRLPDKWAGDSLKDTELVLCIYPEKERVIEICEYMVGSNIKRYNYEVTIHLRSAYTGEIIERTVLEGDNPRDCKLTEDWNTTSLHGSHVSFNQVKIWARRYVNP